MRLKIVAQLLGRNKYSIEKLVRLKVPGLCLVEDLADVVDRLLDGLDPCGWSGSSTSWPSIKIVVVGPPPSPRGTC
jgi:hypothetical protein